jgi:hypothetical protein
MDEAHLCKSVLQEKTNRRTNINKFKINLPHQITGSNTTRTPNIVLWPENDMAFITVLY